MAAANAKRPRADKGRADKGEGEKPLAAIRLKQKQSGKEKRIATGFAWDLFLFAGVFGLPLFLRRLPQWGATILALWCFDLLIGRVPAGAAATHVAETALFIVFLAVQLWLGFVGNRLTVKAFLAHGWIIDPSNDPGIKRLIERWNLG